MATSVVSSSQAASTNLTDANGVTINAPASIASGDFLVAVLSGPYTGSVVWTAPSGWTLAASDHHSSVSLESRVYTKTAGGSEPSSYAWTTTLGAGSYAGVITAFRGTTGLNTVTGANPVDVVMGTTNPRQESGTTSPVWPGLGVYAVSWHAVGSTGMSCTGNIGTERGDASTTDGSPSTHERGVAVYTHGSGHAAGSYGSLGIATMSSAPTASIMWAIDLADAGAASWSSTAPAFGSSFTASRTNRITPFTPSIPAFTDSFLAGREGPLVEMLIDGVWTDITSYVRYEEGISVSYGRSSSASSMSTAMCQFRLDNRPDSAQSRWSLRNPTSPLYGKIGRNTQLRVSKLEFGYRFWGEVAAWTPGADDTNGDRYVDIEASGIVRRLDATSAPQDPALVREIATQSPNEYWPCDEREGATGIASGLVGGSSLKVQGAPEYASYTKLVCSNAIPQVAGSTWSSPPFRGVNLTTGVTLAFLLSIPDSGIASNSNILEMQFPYTSTAFPEGAFGWLGLEMLSTGLLYANAFPLSGSAGAATGTVPLLDTNGVMVYIGIQRATSGSFNFGLWYQGEGDESPVLVGTSSWTGGAGGAIKEQAVKTFVVNPDQLTFGGSASVYVGNITVWSGYGPSGTYSFNSIGAYSGEPAGVRFQRICDEEGIPCVVDDPTNSSLMGGQGAKTTIELLRECEATDMGIMYERRDAFGLGYLVRRDLYNQAPELIIDYSNGELATQLNPTFDDKGVQNDVTVVRDGGSSARYQLTRGPLSVNAPPLGVGPYTASETVSLAADSQCYAQAGWRAHLGSVDEERVTSVGVAIENVEFQKNPNLWKNAATCTSGSRLLIINTPDWSGEVDQIVQGYSERFDNFTHQITYNTNPASPYSTAVAPTTPTNTSAKADSLTSTLDSDADSTTTTLSVDVTGVLWRTGTVAFDVSVGGEQMSVTSISGTSSPQTFTVTRSVNGITKSHTAGDQVSLAKPAIIAL